MALNYSFPQELLDHILKYLRPDKPSLLSTSLVCRAWRAPSQRGLFYSFTTFLSVNNPQAEILQPSACLVLFKESAHLARYVRDLTIRSMDIITEPTSDLLHLLSYLPFLKSLLLDVAPKAEAGILPLVSAVLQYLQERKTLIHTVSLEAPTTLPPDILYLLPGSYITKLTVSDLRAGAIGTGTIAHQIPRTPLPLEELNLGLFPDTVTALVAALQKLRPWVPHLRTIILSMFSPLDVNVILKILAVSDMIPTSVGHFGLICPYWDWLHQIFVPRLDLRLTNITNLTFGIEPEGAGVYGNSRVAKTAKGWANVLHDMIPCSLGLRKVTLHFVWIVDPDVVDAWLLLDTTIAKLDIEEVAFSGSQWRDEDVYVALPELLRKGVIHL